MSKYRMTSSSVRPGSIHEGPGKPGCGAGGGEQSASAEAVSRKLLAGLLVDISSGCCARRKWIPLLDPLRVTAICAEEEEASNSSATKSSSMSDRPSRASSVICAAAYVEQESKHADKRTTHR
jgi:hypothetical protein